MPASIRPTSGYVALRRNHTVEPLEVEVNPISSYDQLKIKAANTHLASPDDECQGPCTPSNVSLLILERALAKRNRQARALQAEQDSLSERNQRDMFPGAITADYLDEQASCTPTLVIMPANRIKKAWDSLMLSIILYFAISVPFRVGFSTTAAGVVATVEELFFACFWVDIFLSFNTAVALPDGRFLLRRDEIARYYLQFWFWIDVAGSLPYSSLLERAEALPSLGPWLEDHVDPAAFRFLRVLRLLRLVKVLRINALVASVEIQYNVDLRGLRLVMLVVQIIYLAHVLACAWFLVADLSGRDGAPTWLSTYDDGVAGEAATPVQIKYLYSIYWALTTLTTVGYGDITPANDTERLFTSATLLIGGLVFGYMIGNVSGMMAQLSRQADEVRDKMDAVKDYVAWRNMPPVLAQRIKTYFTYFYTTRPASIDEREILEMLTPALRKEATMRVLSETIGKVPALQRVLTKEVQMEVFPLLKPCLYAAGEVVYKRGDPSDALLFLLEGQVAMLSTVDGDVVSQVSLAAAADDDDDDGGGGCGRW